ncbi:MAG TPA: MBL fold metallo-hydrolase, partial [Candidatus Dormibacteraeota bacterium]
MTAGGTSLTFLNTGDPTGLKFVVERGGRRAVFDFGIQHAPGRAPFSMGLRPRPGRELADLIWAGEAPRLDGVYARDGGGTGSSPGGGGTGSSPGGGDSATAVFLSHLHLDHSSLVRFLDPAVPLYYPARMEELRAAVERSEYLRWRPGSPGTPVGDRETVQWGELVVRFIAVDHDLPGATGFLIQAPDVRIAYTGDLRWHGFHPELSAGFVEAVRGVDVLVQEGVGLGYLRPEADAAAVEPPRLSESDLVSAFRAELERRPGALLLVNLYPMNRERVAAFGTAAAERGRRLVMEPQAAAIAGWDALFESEEVAVNPGAFVVQLSFEGLPALIDLPAPPGSAYIHSSGPPLGAYDPAYRVVQAWAAVAGLDFLRLGTSGHS